MSLKALYRVTESAQVITETVIATITEEKAQEETKIEVKEPDQAIDTSYYKIKPCRTYEGYDGPGTYSEVWLKQLTKAIAVPTFKFKPPSKDNAEMTLKQLKGKKREVYQSFLAIAG
jgi:hypothetical protein